MKSSIVNCLFIGTVFALTSFAPSAEFIYTSIEGKLSIAFPAAYETSTKKTEKSTTVKTQASLEDQLFYVSHSVHKSTVHDHESLAATSLKSFSQSLGGTVTDQASWSINSHDGVQAVIETSASNLKVAYRAILIGQIQYQIVVASESSKWNQEKADKFIKSFKVEE